MSLTRISNHLLTTHWGVNRAFPRSTLNAIEQTLKESNAAHVGEIRFAVEGALHSTPLFKGQTARERAVDVFAQLRLWDTEHNNGVLIYLLLADSAVEILADRGIASKVPSTEWQYICRAMESAFKQRQFEAGVIAGIHAVTQRLIAHFPAHGKERHELLDVPAGAAGRTRAHV